MKTHSFDLVIGLDRSDRKADLYYIDTRTGRRWCQSIDTTPEALWHARRKFIQRMTVAGALRKKTVVALARQLAVDLWRWRTGRASLAELGLVVPASV